MSEDTRKVLVGSITKVNTYHTDAYAIAVRNGFEGTEAEWLDSLSAPARDALAEFYRSEGERAAAEAERESAEEKRERGESERAASFAGEAQAREQAFEAEEQERGDAFEAAERARQNRFESVETERQRAEENRQAAETKRVSAETVRATNEQTRQSNETARTTQFASWSDTIEDVKQGENNAKAAATRAETAASSASSAAQTALADAKASGVFDGVDGKSAYEYAQDGGYTGTEDEFATLLANAVDKRNITLGLHTDGLIYIFIDGVPTGNGIALPSGGVSGDVVGNVDSANNIVLLGNLADGTYTVKYEMEDGSTIDVGNMVLDSNIYYSVTNDLTDCTSDNNETSVIKGGSYYATISVDDGYELSEVIVTMGGTDISSDVVRMEGTTVAVIDIANVTGDIVITAVVENEAVINQIPISTDADGNLYVGTNGEKGYKSGYKLSTTSGNESSASGACVSGFIPLKNGVQSQILIENITLSSAASINNVVFYKADKTKISGYAGTAGAFTSNVEVIDGVYQIFTRSWFTADDLPAFIRFSCGEITDETIVTVNEWIE